MDSIDSWVSNPAESHGPLMAVVTWCLVSISGAFLAVRLFIRQKQGKLWLDDYALIVSWVSGKTLQGRVQSTDRV